jgi:hypothetical protein
MRLGFGFASVSLLACAAGSGPTAPDDDVFELEPGLFISRKADGKADLPNSAFTPRVLDTSGYRAIANLFVAASYDVHRTTMPAAFDWPLTGSRAVLSREGTPIRLASDVYEHTGLDVIRLTETEEAIVHAPLAGTAIVSDWYGTQQFPWGDYSTVVSIWDPDTHLVVQLMHVKADPMLPRGTFFPVTRGQPLGELADIGIAGGRHTHLNVVDAEHFELLDPITVMPQYLDTTKPVAHELYLLDAMGARHDALVSGPLDIVVSAHDRDDMSPRNLEVVSIAYSARDEMGNELGHLDRCLFSDAFKKLATDWSMSTSTIRLIDFGNATGQFSGFWPSSDLGNPDRLFRYAVTNLVQNNGTCAVVANDRDGQLVIADTVTSLTVTVDLWDDRDNRETKQFTLARAPTPPPMP